MRAYQKCNLQAGFAFFEEQRAAFEKVLSAHSAKLYCVTNRDDGDGVLDIAVVLKKIVTVVTH